MRRSVCCGRRHCACARRAPGAPPQARHETAACGPTCQGWGRAAPLLLARGLGRDLGGVRIGAAAGCGARAMVGRARRRGLSLQRGDVRRVQLLAQILLAQLRAPRARRPPVSLAGRPPPSHRARSQPARHTAACLAVSAVAAGKRMPGSTNPSQREPKLMTGSDRPCHGRAHATPKPPCSGSRAAAAAAPACMAAAAPACAAARAPSSSWAWRTRPSPPPCSTRSARPRRRRAPGSPRSPLRARRPPQKRQRPARPGPAAAAHSQRPWPLAR